MPELPDVEVFRRALQKRGLGRVVAQVELHDATRLLEGLRPDDLRRALEGHSLSATARHGKHLFAHIDGNGWLMLHFGMTGFLSYGDGSQVEDAAHVHLVLRFRDGGHVAFNNRRKLGRIGLTDSPEAFAAANDLGPDALTLDADAFGAALDDRGGTIKGLLMNQELMAGIGNIYSDEILFQAGVHPKTVPAQLDPAARRRLFNALGEVFRQAIDAGADPQRMPDTFLTPLRRQKGARCPYCGGAPARLTVAGRSAWFCPCRQPEAGS